MKGDREKERGGREGRKREVGRKEIGKAGRERERGWGGVPVGGDADKQNNKKEFLCCSIFEGLESKVPCLSIRFFAVKSWTFLGLICRFLCWKGF